MHSTESCIGDNVERSKDLAVDENNQEEIKDITDACVAFSNLSMYNNTVELV